MTTLVAEPLEGFIGLLSGDPETSAKEMAQPAKVKRRADADKLGRTEECDRLPKSSSVVC
jgi:hypothetical protein